MLIAGSSGVVVVLGARVQRSARALGVVPSWLRFPSSGGKHGLMTGAFEGLRDRRRRHLMTPACASRASAGGPAQLRRPPLVVTSRLRWRARGGFRSRSFVSRRRRSRGRLFIPLSDAAARFSRGLRLPPGCANRQAFGSALGSRRRRVPVIVRSFPPDEQARPGEDLARQGNPRGCPSASTGAPARDACERAGMGGDPSPLRDPVENAEDQGAAGASAGFGGAGLGPGAGEAGVLAYRTRLRMGSVVMYFRAKGLRQGAFLFLAAEVASTALSPRPLCPANGNSSGGDVSTMAEAEAIEDVVLLATGRGVPERGGGPRSEVFDDTEGVGSRAGGGDARGVSPGKTALAARCSTGAAAELCQRDPRCWITDESSPLAEALPVHCYEAGGGAPVNGEATVALVNGASLSTAQFCTTAVDGGDGRGCDRDGGAAAGGGVDSGAGEPSSEGVEAFPPRPGCRADVASEAGTLTLWLMPSGRAPVPSICCGVCGSSWEKDAFGRGFRVYHMAVANDVLVWYVRRRFSEFLALHRALVKEGEAGEHGSQGALPASR